MELSLLLLLRLWLWYLWLDSCYWRNSISINIGIYLIVFVRDNAFKTESYFNFCAYMQVLQSVHDNLIACLHFHIIVICCASLCYILLLDYKLLNCESF